MKANNIRARRSRPAGFTLVELLVVIGLMAMMGTISIGGYFAASRGMKTRGAIQDTISFIRNAQQSCIIDNAPVAVLFVNRFTGKRDDGGEMYGTAIAVKMAGRISNIARSWRKESGSRGEGAMLIDEFADWNASFPHDSVSGSGDERGMRLYNMYNIEQQAKQGLDRCSSFMNNWVGYIRMVDKDDYEIMLVSGRQTDEWCNEFRKNASDNRNNGLCDYNNGNDFRWGLGFHKDNKGLTEAGWEIGHPYGTEIGVFDLPKGFIFGSSMPKDTGKIEAAGGTAAIVFTPDKAKSDGSFTFTTVSIYGIGVGGKEDAVGKVGDIKPSDTKDQN